MNSFQNPFRENPEEENGGESRPPPPESAGLPLRIGAFAADIFLILVLVLTITNFFVIRQNPDAARELQQYSEEAREYREAERGEEAVGPQPELSKDARRLLQTTYVVTLVLILLYFVLGELLTRGASPGKLVFKLGVIRTDPGDAALPASATVVRSVIKAVTLALSITHPLLLVFLFNYFFAFLTQDRRAGHDYIARTRVVPNPPNRSHGSASVETPAG